MIAELTGRRDFIKGGLSAATGLMVGNAAVACPGITAPVPLRAVYLTMGRNMWGVWCAPGESKTEGVKYAHEKLEFSEVNWRRLTDRAVAKKYNMVVIDLGEFVRYPSAPELAVEGSWDPDRLRAELRRLRGLGLEPIPKLNFSAAHDAWLKEYSRMHATKPYYDVCSRVIGDVAEIFDTPRFIHIGWDEERFKNFRNLPIVSCRQGEMWWHDFLWFVKTVEGRSMRAWVWSDYGWHHDEFVTRCPKSVLQSNWYYDDDLTGFDPNDPKNHFKCILDLYVALDKAGFDQIPCGSNWVSPIRKKAGVGNSDSIGKLIRYCRERISPERLKGFLMAPWAGSETEKGCLHNLEGIDLMAKELDA